MTSEAGAIQARAWVDGAARGAPGDTDQLANRVVDQRTPPPDRFEIEIASQ